MARAAAVKVSDKDREHARIEQLQVFSQAIKKKLDAAIAARTASGIEIQWWEDQEHYEGIDDANRPENMIKPWNNSSTATAKATPTRSTVFLNITESFCDQAAGALSDMLQPSDDRAWALEPLPVKELMDIAGPVDEPPQVLPLAGPDGKPLPSIAKTVLDWAVTEVDKARKQAKAAEKRIEGWHVRCNYHGAVRSVIDDWARLGSGVLKGPVPVLRKARKIENKDGLVAITTVLETPPASKCVSPWDFWPDGNCGENIHNGSHCFERDYFSGRQLRNLRDDPHYIASQIDECLLEGPAKAKTERKPSADGIQPSDKDRYEVFYFTGDVARRDLECANCSGLPAPTDAANDGTDTFSAQITLINGRIVKANLNPLESGELPYDVIPWGKRANMPWGRGVSRQLRACQRIINAAFRNLLDNAGISAGGMFVIRDGAVVPADGVWEIGPRKIWKTTGEDGEEIDASKVFNYIEIPSLQEELLAIVQFAMEFGEDTTSLRALMQNGNTDLPETNGIARALQAQAGPVKRRFAKAFDDHLTEPQINRYYEWLLLDPDVPDEEKGEFEVDARGSSALVDRDLENESIAEILVLAKDPAYGADPKKCFGEWLRSRRLDPARFQYEPGKQPPPQPSPEMIVAKSAEKVADTKAAAETQKSNNETRVAELTMQLKTQESESKREHEAVMAQLNYVTAAAKVASQEKISLDEAKAMLAATVIKTRTDQAISEQEIALEWDKLRREQAQSAAAPRDPEPAAVH